MVCSLGSVSLRAQRTGPAQRVLLRSRSGAANTGGRVVYVNEVGGGLGVNVGASMDTQMQAMTGRKGAPFPSSARLVCSSENGLPAFSRLGEDKSESGSPAGDR